MVLHLAFLDKKNDFYGINCRVRTLKDEYDTYYRIEYFDIYDVRERYVEYPENVVIPATPAQAIIIGIAKHMRERKNYPFHFPFYQKDGFFITKQHRELIYELILTCCNKDDNFDGLSPEEKFLLKTEGLHPSDKKHIVRLTKYIYKIGNTEYIIAERDELYNIVHYFVKKHTNLDYVRDNLHLYIKSHEDKPLAAIEFYVKDSYVKIVAEQGNKVLVRIDY